MTVLQTFLWVVLAAAAYSLPFEARARVGIGYFSLPFKGRARVGMGDGRPVPRSA